MGDRAGSDWDAARYDKLADPHTAWGRGVLERLVLHGDETVLDAGCGTARVTELLLDRLPKGKVIAIDLSSAMLEQAKVRLAAAGDRARLVQLDLLELSPECLGSDAPVDAVFSTATLHWIIDHELLFKNLASVLVPGGQLVAQCGGRGNIENVIQAVRSLGVKRAGTWLYASPEDTSRRLRNAGFTDIEVWSHPEPTRFSPGRPLTEFLETVCLREHLNTLPAEERSDFATRVAEAMGEPVIDYVRLNITARRTH